MNTETKLQPEYILLIHQLKDESLACITSMVYQKGFNGLKYFELRKLIFKELQRVDSGRHKKYTE